MPNIKKKPWKELERRECWEILRRSTKRVRKSREDKRAEYI